MLSDKNSSVKIAVLGGGFVGITLAARLLDVENIHVTVFDQDPIKIAYFKTHNYLRQKSWENSLLI
jgi:glycine/D-amino acid oxidase-like deaminating enzyme